MTRKFKILTVLLALSFALSFSPAMAADKVPTSATVKISGGSFALGIGWSWGSGSLNYKGREYPFRISGLKIVDVGGSSYDAIGEVYYMKDLADFEGTVLVISHDRYFLDRVTDHILALEGGDLNEFIGNFSDYQEQKGKI